MDRQSIVLSAERSNGIISRDLPLFAIRTKYSAMIILPWPSVVDVGSRSLRIHLVFWADPSLVCFGVLGYRIPVLIVSFNGETTARGRRTEEEFVYVSLGLRLILS